MKKILVAVALASGLVTTHSQPTVEVYGLIDMSYNLIKSTGVDTNEQTAIGGASVTGANSSNGTGVMNGSRLGFRGTEDLGGGTKAGFQIEYGLNLTTSTDTQAAQTAGTTMANIRQGWVSLGNTNYGTVKAGTVSSYLDPASGSNAALHAHVGTNSVAGAAYLFKYGLGSTPRNSNAVAYESPNMAGVTVRVLKGQGETIQNSTSNNARAADATSYAVDYNAGKLKLAAAVYQLDNVTNVATSVVDIIGTTNDTAAINNAGAANVKSTAIVALYDLGFATVSYNRQNYTNSVIDSTKVNLDSKTDIAAIMFPIDAKVKVGGAYAKGSIEQSGAKAYDTKGIDLLAVYDFSKRTNVYALYAKTGFDQVSSSRVYEQESLSFGLRHAF
jgi:predicted porin